MCLGGGFGFYFKHNARPLKGFATVNRKEYKRPIGSWAQPHKPGIQELTKHSLYCLPDSFHNILWAPDFPSSFSLWLSYNSQMNTNKGERRKGPSLQGPIGLLRMQETQQRAAMLDAPC